MTDAFFLALLGIVGDVLQGVAADVLLEFQQRHRSGPRGEVTEQQLRRAVARTGDGLAELRRGELREVAPHEWEAAVEAARDSLVSGGIDLGLIFDAELDPARLARLVETRGAARLERAGLDPGGVAAYHRIVGLTCEQLIAYFRSLPQFEEVLQSHTFWRVSDVARQLDALLQHQRAAVRGHPRPAAAPAHVRQVRHPHRRPPHPGGARRRRGRAHRRRHRRGERPGRQPAGGDPGRRRGGQDHAAAVAGRQARRPDGLDPGRVPALRAGAAAGRRLATNPLLAGLICALYQDRHMHLPRDRRSLYEAALELPVTRLVIRDRSLAAGLGGIPVELPLTELILDNRPPDRDLRDIDRLTGLTHVEFFGTPAPHELAALGRLPELTALTVHQPGDVRGLVRLPALRRLAVDGIPAARRAAVLTDLRAADHLTVTVDGAAQPYEKGS